MTTADMHDYRLTI